MPGKALHYSPCCPLLLRPLRVLYYCTSCSDDDLPCCPDPAAAPSARAESVLIVNPAQGICHCHAYHAPLGLPRRAVWRAVNRPDAGTLPYSLLCRPTGWIVSLEGPAISTRFDEEARLLLYERRYEVDLCASQGKSERNSTQCRLLPEPSCNSILWQAVNSSRRCVRWRGPQSICCMICRGASRGQSHWLPQSTNLGQPL
jgi:hypothetical protein